MTNAVPAPPTDPPDTQDRSRVWEIHESHETWFNAYQFSIRPIMRSKMWKRNEHQPPLPPVVMKMPGRPRKEKVKAQPLPKADKGKKVATSLEPLPKVDKGKTKKKER
ncbi:hypothetical protein Tco_1410440 [Tanacetum coccineum]